MIGNIYTNEKCPVCSASLTHDANIDGFRCTKDRNHNVPMPKEMRVRFGKKTQRRFYKYNYPAARQYLEGLRFKKAEGTYDARDYQKDAPLGFSSLANKWLSVKESQIKPKSFNNLRNYMVKAQKAWGQTNIKMIGYSQIEDFLYDPRVVKNDKTRSNIKSCLHTFFKWISKREKIPVPDMPECEFDLGWRAVTDLKTQAKIITKIGELTYHKNPKIWFGIELLATYPKLRPDDLRRITEADYNVEYGLLTIHNPTKTKNNFKIVRLLPEHNEIWVQLRNQYRGLPHMPFFRHIAGISGCKAGQVFGNKYFYKIWKTACDELGIEGLDLYGGTRHTTVTEIARIAGHDNAKKASGHHTNKAFERYCQAQDETAYDMARVVLKKKGGEVVKFPNKYEK